VPLACASHPPFAHILSHQYTVPDAMQGILGYTVFAEKLSYNWGLGVLLIVSGLAFITAATTPAAAPAAGTDKKEQ
jgi:hypothetical protein